MTDKEILDWIVKETLDINRADTFYKGRNHQLTVIQEFIRDERAKQ